MRWLPTITVDQLPEDMDHLPNRLLPFIWYFVRQAKWPLSMIAVCWTVSNILWALSFYFVKLFVDGIGHTTPAHMYHDIGWIIASFVGLIVIAQSAFWRMGAYIEVRTKARFPSMMRRQLALYLHEHSYGYFQDDFAGRLASKVVETPMALRSVVLRFLESFVGNIVSLTTSCILLAMIGWPFLLFLAAIMVWYVLILRKFLPVLLTMSTVAADTQSHMRGRYVDIVSNILSVKLFARKDHEDRYFLSSLRDTAEGYERLHLKYFSLMQWLDSFLKCLWLLPTLLALEFWRRDMISVGDVALILTLCINLGRDLWNFCFALAEFTQDIGQVQEGMQTITRHSGVHDRAGAGDLIIEDAGITFRDISFAYGAHKVFDHFDLTIPAGQRVGLVGPSGAGKSTLIQLLLRLYDVQQGAILIGGEDIASVRQDSLRTSIGMIPQSTELMHRSIRDNIRYGRLDAVDDDIIKAARRAHADDFIGALRDADGRTGYDAFAGERGVKLSGGQRQRVAIARAILKDAPILILDEATSALDSESERLIQESLLTLMHGKTVIAIAHRLSTLAHMDRLIVLDQGRIVEDGSHTDLLAQGGLYAKLWSLQSGGFLK